MLNERSFILFSPFLYRYVGGFTRKMRVCKLRHSSSGEDMYILTAENCENFAARGRIGEEFNFYVANSQKSRYSTSRYRESFEKTTMLFVIFSEAVTEKDKDTPTIYYAKFASFALPCQGTGTKQHTQNIMDFFCHLIDNVCLLFLHSWRDISSGLLFTLIPVFFHARSQAILNIQNI